MMDSINRHLIQLGFTELESKCLIVLAENKELTGYEVAKKLGSSRSNVYASLQNLQDSGLILCSVGEPKIYQSLPLEEMENIIQEKMNDSFNYLRNHFPLFLRKLDNFYTLDGEKQVFERTRLELAKAKKEILADIWTEEADLFGDLLLEAEQNEVNVIVSSVGMANLPLKKVIIHGREEAWQEKGWRKFSYVIDRQVAILGVRGNGYATKALLTEHPAMVMLLLNNFFHDLVIHEIMSDMKDEVLQRYGRNFEEVYKKYTGSGWGEDI